MKINKLLIGLSSLLLLVGCSNGNPQEKKQEEDNTVTQEEWTTAFSFENIALRSNYKITLDSTMNRTMSFDNGKIHQVGVGKNGDKEQYFDIKGAANFRISYDIYFFEESWSKSEGEADLDTFFANLGLFKSDYEDFDYDKNTHEYKLNSAGKEKYMFSNWIVKFENNNIKYQTLSYEGVDSTYRYSDYGAVSITLPEVEPQQTESKVLAVYNPSNTYISSIDVKEEDVLSVGEYKLKVTAGMRLASTGFTQDNYRNVFIHIDGVVYRASSLPESSTTIDTLEITVNIPDHDFDIFVYYQEGVISSEGHLISINGLNSPIIGLDIETKYSKFVGYIIIKENELIDSAQYKFESESEYTDLGNSMASMFYCYHPTGFPSNFYKIALGRQTTVISENISLKFEVSTHTLRTITYDISDESIVDLNNSELPLTAMDSVKVYIYVKFKNGVTGSVTSKDVTLVTTQSGYIEFVMPNKDITISISEFVANVELHVEENTDVSYAKFTSEDDSQASAITKASNGQTIYLFVAVKGNIKPTSVSYEGKTVTLKYRGLDNDESDPNRLYVAEVTVPSEIESLTASITTEEGHLISIEEDSMLSLSNGPCYITGETVYALYSEETSALVIKNTNDEIVSIPLEDYYNQGRFAGKSFIMPDYDLKISLSE